MVIDLIRFYRTVYCATNNMA